MRKIYTILLLAIILINFSCSTEKGESKKDLKVLVIGNSILRHSPAPNLGWYGDWGMAASSPEKDFLHVYESLLQTSDMYKSVEVSSKNLAVWENDFNYNLNNFQDLNTQNYDILIVRLGENVANIPNYYAALNAMINFFKTEKTKVIITGIVWDNDQVENVQKQVALENDYEYIPFDVFKTDPLNYSWGLFESGPVAAHPSDLGMKNIAELLYISTTIE